MGDVKKVKKAMETLRSFCLERECPECEFAKVVANESDTGYSVRGCLLKQCWAGETKPYELDLEKIKHI